MFLFTAALFLSGYVLQQKTVRDIRIAIRPQTVTRHDQLYLPPQFEEPQIRVLGDEETEVVVNVQQDSGSDASNAKAAKKRKGSKPLPKSDNKQEIADQKPIEATGGIDGAKEENQQPRESDQTRPLENKVQEKPLSKAARRKKIKEEVLAAGEGEGYKGYRRRMW